METADRRVKQLRRHVAEWGEPASGLGEEATGFDARFREAVANDLDMPTAVRVVNDLDRSPDAPGREARAAGLLGRGAGLDLERDAREAWEPSEEILALVAGAGRRARGEGLRPVG